jgi:hypothetical protein
MEDTFTMFWLSPLYAGWRNSHLEKIKQILMQKNAFIAF